MPTFEAVDRFRRDYEQLDPQQREAFKHARDQFVEDLGSGGGFRPGLRVKRVQGAGDVWEMSWAPNGRATWQYGSEQREGHPHVIWRRIGTHDVFRRP